MLREKEMSYVIAQIKELVGPDFETTEICAAMIFCLNALTEDEEQEVLRRVFTHSQH